MALRKHWTLVLPELRFNYPDVPNFYSEPFEFFFDLSALKTLSSYGYSLLMHSRCGLIYQSCGTSLAVPVWMCRLSVATFLPRSKHQVCLTQLQHSLEHAISPSMHTLDAWADRHGVVCLRDRHTIDNHWTQQYMNDVLKQQIRKALRPSLQFRVRIWHWFC